MLKLFPTFYRAAEDGNGQGAAPPASSTPPAPAGNAPPVSGAEGAPPAAAPGQAQAAAPAAAPAADYWPEGLDQQFKGADQKSTMDNLAKALSGYRARDAQRGVPEKPEGYYDFADLKDFKIEDSVKGYFDQLPSDPAFKAMAGVLHKHGVGKVAALEAFQAGLAGMSEAGLLEPVLDPAKEKLALVPEAARNLPQAAQDQAVQRRMQENYDFLALMQSTRELSPDAAKYAELMLGDSARGHQFFEWVRSQVQGGAGAGPGDHGGRQPANTREGLRTQLAELEKHKGSPDYAKRHAELSRQYEQTLGN